MTNAWMRKVIVVVALIGAFALAFTHPLHASDLGAEVQTWRYDRETKVLSVKIANTSSKDIVAYNVSIILKYADGSTDALSDGRASSERMTDELGALISAQMVKGTANEDMVRLNGNGFGAGTTRNEVLPQIKDVVDVKAVVDMVIYADCAAEVQNERAFNQIITMRKGALLALQKIAEVIKQALADPSVESPITQARMELAQLALAEAGKHRSPEDPEGNQEMQFRSALSVLANAQQVSKQMNMTEADYLKKYVEDTDKRIALMLPHTQITRVGDPK